LAKVVVQFRGELGRVLSDILAQHDVTQGQAGIATDTYIADGRTLFPIPALAVRLSLLPLPQATAGRIPGTRGSRGIRRGTLAGHRHLILHLFLHPQLEFVEGPKLVEWDLQIVRMGLPCVRLDPWRRRRRGLQGRAPAADKLLNSQPGRGRLVCL
jgi:hypothetical protein